MSIRDSEHEPDSVKLKHLAGRIRQSVSYFDKRKIVPILGYQLGFRYKTALYDGGATLVAGDDFPRGICYDSDRNRILITCGTTPTRLLIMNPEDMTYTRLTLVGTTAGSRCVDYDGQWYWVSTEDAAASQVVRINPDTLAFTILTLPNDGAHNLSRSICIAEVNGKRYVFVGLIEQVTFNAARIVRIDPATFPAYTEINVGIDVMGNVYITQALVFDGTWVWAGHNDGRVTRINPDTLAWTRVATGIFGAGQTIISESFDGSYVWWGSGNARIAKFNPSTYAFDVVPLQGASELYGMCFDGKYIHAVDYAGTDYIVHPETMEYAQHEYVGAGMYHVIFDGMYIWIPRDLVSGNPNMILRLLIHEPSRRVETGRTATFAIDALANISIAVTFDLPFTRTPTVVIGLNDVSDQSASIVNVEAQTVTTAGFNARCRVAVVGAGGSTARFMWIATERSTHHP